MSEQHFAKYRYSQNTSTLITWLTSDTLMPPMTIERAGESQDGKIKGEFEKEQEAKRLQALKDAATAGARISKIANELASQILAAINNFDRNGSIYFNHTMSSSDGNADIEAELRALIKAKLYIHDLPSHVWEALASGSSFLLPLFNQATKSIVFYAPLCNTQEHYLNNTIVLDINQALSSRLGLTDHDPSKHKYLFTRNGKYIIDDSPVLTSELNNRLEAQGDTVPAPNLISGMPILVLELGTRHGEILRSSLESSVFEARLEANLYERANSFLRNSVTVVSVANSSPESFRREINSQTKDGSRFVVLERNNDPKDIQVEATPLLDGKEAEAIGQIAALYPDAAQSQTGTSSSPEWSTFVAASAQRLQRTFETYVSQHLPQIAKRLSGKIKVPDYMAVTYMLTSEIDRINQEKARDAEQALKILATLQQLDPERNSLDWERLSRFFSEKIPGFNLSFSSQQADLQRQVAQLQERDRQSAELVSQLMSQNELLSQELATVNEKITIQDMENQAKLAQVEMGNRSREKIHGDALEVKALLEQFEARNEAQSQTQKERHERLMVSIKELYAQGARARSSNKINN